MAMFTPKSKRLYLYKPSGAANVVMSLESGCNSILWKAIFRSSLEKLWHRRPLEVSLQLLELGVSPVQWPDLLASCQDIF